MGFGGANVPQRFSATILGHYGVGDVIVALPVIEALKRAADDLGLPVLFVGTFHALAA